MAVLSYNVGRKQRMSGEIDMTNDTIQVMMMKSTYTPNKDHANVAAIVANEMTGTGYVRKTLSAKVFTQDDVNDLGVFDDTADLTWTGITMAAATNGIVIFKNGGSDATSPLLWFIDGSGYPVQVVGAGTFVHQHNASGIAAIA